MDFTFSRRTVPEACRTYTTALLEFRLGDAGGGYATRQAPSGAGAPILRLAREGGWLVLLGVGTGRFAAELASTLPEETGFLVLDLSPEHSRPLARALPLACDASPVALAWLLLSMGLTRPQAVLALNPEVADPSMRARLQTVQRLHAAFEPSPGAGTPGPPGEFSLAAILHPEEPGLEDFFARLPATAREAVVVWDAVDVPGTVPHAPIPVRSLAHPLESDFAAQRNRMLAACRTDWILYLDADERLDTDLAAMLPGLCSSRDCRAHVFPRLALSPEGARIGWGLWPDLQLRLFRAAPGVRFVRPVHERVEGLTGPTGLVPGAYIRHLSGLTKTPETLARKLALFDAAGGARGLHRLNVAYPSLPEDFFRQPPFVRCAGTWPESIRFEPLCR